MKPFFLGAFCALLGTVTLAYAQEQVQVGDVKVKIEYDTQPTPNFGDAGTKGKRVSNPKDWLEIEVEFEADARPRDGVIPELMFRYHVAIQSAGGETQLLSGDVSHVNVIAGEKSYSVAYVSPATLGTITGDFRKFQPSAIKAVAVEVMYNGVLKGGDSTSGSGRWWEQMAGKQGVLSKDKTPFALLWIDRYADLKAE